MQCARHPRVETLLRCGKCDAPICPDCTVFGPAGARCRDCAALRSSPLYQVPVGYSVLGGALGLALGAIAGLVCGYAVGTGLFAQVWVGVLGGWAAGEVVLRAVRRKRGRTVEALTLLSVGLGCVAGLAVWAMLDAGIPTLGDFVQWSVHSPGLVAGPCITTMCAWSRTRM